MTNPALPSEEEELRWVKRLQGRYPEHTRGIDPEELRQRVREAFALNPTLEITEEKDAFRLIALSVLLTPEQKRSTLAQGVMQRVLAHLDWDATQRLDFLYKHLIGRPVSSKEMDFGPNFIPSPTPPPDSSGHAPHSSTERDDE